MLASLSLNYHSILSNTIEIRMSQIGINSTSTEFFCSILAPIPKNAMRRWTTLADLRWELFETTSSSTNRHMRNMKSSARWGLLVVMLWNKKYYQISRLLEQILVIFTWNVWTNLQQNMDASIIMEPISSLIQNLPWEICMLIKISNGIFAISLLDKIIKEISMDHTTPIKLYSEKNITSESYIFYYSVDRIRHPISLCSNPRHQVLVRITEVWPQEAQHPTVGTMVLPKYQRRRSRGNTRNDLCDLTIWRSLLTEWSAWDRLLYLWFFLERKIPLINVWLLMVIH